MEININLVINISIAVFIGLTVSNIFSDVISKFVSEALKHILFYIGKLISPLTFNITGRNNTFIPNKFGEELFIPKSTTAVSWEFSIEPVTRFHWMYKNDHENIIVNYLDESDKLLAYSGKRLDKGIYRVGEYKLDIGRANRINVSVQNRFAEIDKDCKIGIMIVYDGNYFPTKYFKISPEILIN